MADATRLQVGRGATAFATALIVLAIGWLGARHEAEVAHVRDRDGQTVHAQSVPDCHDDVQTIGTTAHLHGRDAHGHAGVCSLLAILHASLGIDAPLGTPATLHHVAQLAFAIAAAPPAAVAPYRLAPKTSPPSHG